MHVFVTGGTGFFGKALLRYWASSPVPGMAATILSRSPDAFRARCGDLLRGLDVRLVEGDVLRPATLPASGDFTHVLHAATESTIGPSLGPLQRYDRIVDGSRNVLDMAVRLGIRRVLVTSSGGVYGPQPAAIERLPEDYGGMPDPLNPQNAYSVAKRAVEHLCALYADQHGLEPVIARCFAFVGQDLPLDAHFAIGNFIADALAGRDIVVQGDGTPVRSYLDQRDLAHWLTVLLLRGRPQRAYNVGSDEAVTLAEVAARVQRLAGHVGAVQVLRRAASGQSAQRSRYVPDISRAGAELGLRVEVPLDDAISWTLRRRRSAHARA
ncbi:MAG: NAD-dependent epimerase/dehydratase family protein [Burkholderiaceae bacterium]